MVSNLDSTDATACCRKFHLDTDFGALCGEAIVRTVVEINQGGMKAAMIEDLIVH
jgi:hypothetical protein